MHTPRPRSPFPDDVDLEELMDPSKWNSPAMIALSNQPAHDVPDSIAVYGNGKDAIKAHIDVLIGRVAQTALFT
ncbi:hypothetical protein EXIGLDRAFT_730757 [Exidia glandulosa HHB12029]|uniref:Uncharacterized protein n=1 Tax=Exidia glandulosa HHB12029 TaxID=1314781 RepID=A0A165C2U4_EXIGL|nr:hypothetical protein EXIGLDRAFT_730757 [Exidia glandulosa HHB12029]